MMKGIATEMNQATGALRVRVKRPGTPQILDFCTAPGGFLDSAMKINSGARATAFSLPPTQGGHEVIMRLDSNVTFKYADVTMFAGDLGYTDIPNENPDAENFVLGRSISPEQRFHLVFCDGQVLRTHARAAYRERWEARRLTATQLAIGLEHVSAGGTMVVLLHKLDATDSASLLYTFSKFSSIKLFKPTRAHAKRSSFYMVATNVRNNSPHAREAIEAWKLTWRIMTFGCEEERQKTAEGHMDEQLLVEQFGPDLVRLGKGIWEIQAEALEKAPFMQAGQNEDRKTG
jgi:23S rRNA U2552 (ribose-2'-O)-methylase RlmE/FtsJ